LSVKFSIWKRPYPEALLQFPWWASNKIWSYIKRWLTPDPQVHQSLLNG
jgi:hypothetical protein